MLRRSRRTALAWAAAAAAALVTAVTVLGILASLRHQDEAYGALHPVAVARHDLTIGTRVTAAEVGHRAIRGEAPEHDALTPAQAVGRWLALAGGPAFWVRMDQKEPDLWVRLD